MKESKQVELKETVSSSFLKTVSAFANYGTGMIMFGIDDEGRIKGIDNPQQVCLDIENRINDSIDPVPDYSLEINEKTNVIRLTVQQGLNKPYLYKAKAYRRSDTSTVEVDRTALKRLILEGENITYEETDARSKDLKFDILAGKMKEKMNLSDFTIDTLKTLELYKDRQGYNVAAELLADENSFCGIDMVRFSDSLNVMLDRLICDRKSILLQYDRAVEMYQRYYQYEQIQGFDRLKVSLIPEEAYREGIANAIVHRQWDTDANINVSMYPDRIEILSLGGLPAGVSEEEYYRGISVLRNRIIANVFYRLDMIERFGTGIRKIRQCYEDSAVKPQFDISENSIRIILPVIRKDNGMSEDERKIYELTKTRKVSSSQIVSETGFGKTKTVSIINRLVESGFVRSTGNGRGTRYQAVR